MASEPEKVNKEVADAIRDSERLSQKLDSHIAMLNAGWDGPPWTGLMSSIRIHDEDVHIVRRLLVDYAVTLKRTSEQWTSRQRSHAARARQTSNRFREYARQLRTVSEDETDKEG